MCREIGLDHMNPQCIVIGASCIFWHHGLTMFSIIVQLVFECRVHANLFTPRIKTDNIIWLILKLLYESSGDNNCWS